MNQLPLSRCHFYGPFDDGAAPDAVTMPPELPQSPFDCLPASYSPTAEEVQLAKQYVQGDFSGGYLASQIAHFRMPKSKVSHDRRRERFQQLTQLTDSAALELPSALVQLAQNDDYNDRIRHNTIWFNPVPVLAPFPANKNWKIAELFFEGQGCGYWSVLLASGQRHRMIYCSDSLGNDGEYPEGFVPKIEDFEFYECAESFDEWLVYYLLDCAEEDKRYARQLIEYPKI